MIPTRRTQPSSTVIGLASSALFLLPMALFLGKFPGDAPFFFFAQDSFYYLSIALHSATVHFFTLDGVHPTNGFHPLWENLLFLLSRTNFFRLTSSSVLPKIFGLNLLIVGVAVGLIAAYTFQRTRRPWLAMLSVCPGLLWLSVGIGAPAYLNNWAAVNGMETGLELLFFGCFVLLVDDGFRWGLRLGLAIVTLGFLVLSRLDDVFFLLPLLGCIVLTAPAAERRKRLACSLIPVLMILAYLFYNHHTVGVWLPVSGMAKVGKGYRASIGESLRLLKGWPFWAMPAEAIAFQYGNVYVMVAQMMAPMVVAVAYLVHSIRRSTTNPVLASLALGVLLKGGYNFVRVPIGYQGAWYYGVSLAVANILLAVMVVELLARPTARSMKNTPTASSSWHAAAVVLKLTALLGCSFLSFNIVASRASQNGFSRTRDTFLAAETVRHALIAATSAPFLEFQDGELSFETGLPAVSGFGLAADPEAVRAQKAGTFFRLLSRRGITVAEASGTYPPMLANASVNKKIFEVWGFNRDEIKNYCFQQFWESSDRTVVLYHILHQPICDNSAGTP